MDADGSFSADRRCMFLRIRIYGIKVLSLKLYFDPDRGVFLSVNGKEGKLIGANGGGSGGNFDYMPLVYSLYPTKVEIGIYAGGDPLVISMFLGTVRVAIENLLNVIDRYRAIDERRIRVYPCFVNDQTSVNFSIRFFTSLTLIMQALVHTKIGVKNAKRSNRKFDE